MFIQTCKLSNLYSQDSQFIQRNRTITVTQNTKLYQDPTVSSKHQTISSKFQSKNSSINVKSKTLPVKNIEGDIDPRVPDMAEVVGGDAADVHAHPTRDPRPEELLLLGHGIKEVKLGIRLRLRRNRRCPIGDATEDGLRTRCTGRRGDGSRKGGIF